MKFTIGIFNNLFLSGVSSDQSKSRSELHSGYEIPDTLSCSVYPEWRTVILCMRWYKHVSIF